MTLTNVTKKQNPHKCEGNALLPQKPTTVTSLYTKSSYSTHIDCAALIGAGGIPIAEGEVPRVVWTVLRTTPIVAEE